MLSTLKKELERFAQLELMLPVTIMELWWMEQFLIHQSKKEDHLNFKLVLAKSSEDGMKALLNSKKVERLLLHAHLITHTVKEEQVELSHQTLLWNSMLNF